MSDHWYEIELEYVTNRVLVVRAASAAEARRQIDRGFLDGYELRHSTWLDVLYIGLAEGDNRR